MRNRSLTKNSLPDFACNPPFRGYFLPVVRVHLWSPFDLAAQGLRPLRGIFLFDGRWGKVLTVEVSQVRCPGSKPGGSRSPKRPKIHEPDQRSAFVPDSEPLGGRNLCGFVIGQALSTVSAKESVAVRQAEFGFPVRRRERSPLVFEPWEPGRITSLLFFPLLDWHREHHAALCDFCEFLERRST